MALHGSIATLKAQQPPVAGFATAFLYIAELMREGSPIQQRVRDLADGDAKSIELEHGVSVIEQAYQTKSRADGIFESHRRFIDIQVIYEGEEQIEVADAARLTVRQPYDGERDFLLYHDHPDASLLRLFPGEAAILFPQDAHMPTLRIHAAPVRVRKVVVKVPVPVSPGGGWPPGSGATGA